LFYPFINLLKPVGNSVDYSILVDWNGVVNYKIFRCPCFVEPLFMFFVDLLKVVQGNSILSFS